KCIGCGVCPSLAASTFKLDDNNKAEVFNAAGDDEATIQMAIDSCPTQAISWEGRISEDANPA
ncbi:MAG: ferredoxin, partial [Patescibacteria group bacterium]